MQSMASEKMSDKNYKVHRWIIYNVPISKEKELLSALMPLIKSGVISKRNIRYKEEDEVNLTG